MPSVAGYISVSVLSAADVWGRLGLPLMMDKTSSSNSSMSGTGLPEVLLLLLLDEDDELLLDDEEDDEDDDDARFESISTCCNSAAVGSSKSKSTSSDPEIKIASVR